MNDLSKYVDKIPVLEDETSAVKPTCGIVMPISAMADYDVMHWQRVRVMLERAIAKAEFSARIVSESEETTIIHHSIVQNLYDDEIVVIDVSGKNPNVMFEFGLRMAFDKPTVVVKDDETTYNFDTSPIKHIEYRRDLRFDDVEQFVEKLASAIKASLAAKKKDKNYSPFLRYFGKFTPKKLETEEISQGEFLMKKLDLIQDQLNKIRLRDRPVNVFSDAAVANRKKSDPIMLIVRNAINQALEAYGAEPSGYARNRNQIREAFLNSSTIRSIGMPYEDLMTYFNIAYNELLEGTDV